MQCCSVSYPDFSETMSAWEEVRRLAADFQQVQAASTAHRLSERNCVELVNKLVELRMVNVVYTVDGKEYVTPQHLDREIRDELAASRGRINIVDLQQFLNVDLSHIEARVSELLKRDRTLTFLQGQLLSRAYINLLCEEINDTLQEMGQVSMADVSKSFGLPTDFILENVEACLGTKIKGQLDKMGSGVIYTDSFVARYQARIRGLFNGITRPTAVGQLITQGQFHEKLFNTVLHELISSGELAGSLHGRMDKAVYVPTVYTQMQNRWADSFLNTNGYLEYDALARLGIDDPQAYVSSRYGENEDVVQLQSCCVGQSVLTEVEGAVEEMQSTQGWVDILPLIPSPCTPADAQLLVQRHSGTDPDLRQFGAVITTKGFLQSCFDSFRPLLKEKAQEAATTNASFLTEISTRTAEQDGASQKEKRRRDRRGGRGKRGEGEGGGAGRKKETWELKFLSKEKMVEFLSEKVPEGPEDFLSDVAGHLESHLQEAFLEEAKSCLAQASQGPSASQQRKRHANTQERVQGLWNSARLFEKGTSLFEGDTAAQLSRCLLRTLCSDLFNIVLAYVGEDLGLPVPPLDQMSAKERSRLISTMADHLKRTPTAVNASLNGKDAAVFFQLFEALCAEEHCGFMLRPMDKKKERQLIFSHQQSLLENLKEEQEPAMALHLVTVLLFQRHTNCMIHIPGKLVPSVITFLAGHMPTKDHAKLVQYQQLVVKQLRLMSDRGNSGEADSPAGNPGMGSSSKEKEERGGGQAIAEGASEGAGDAPPSGDSSSVSEQLQEMLVGLKDLVKKPQISNE